MCECKELIDKGVSGKGFIWNTSNCECECDKSSVIGEYLDYTDFKCRKKLVDKWVKECTQNIKEEKITEIILCENKNKHKCSSCTLYVVLFSTFFKISIKIGIYFAYFYWYLKKYDARVILDTGTETTIYWTYIYY